MSQTINLSHIYPYSFDRFSSYIISSNYLSNTFIKLKDNELYTINPFEEKKVIIPFFSPHFLSKVIPTFKKVIFKDRYFFIMKMLFNRDEKCLNYYNDYVCFNRGVFKVIPYSNIVDKSLYFSDKSYKGNIKSFNHVYEPSKLLFQTAFKKDDTSSIVMFVDFSIFIDSHKDINLSIIYRRLSDLCKDKGIEVIIVDDLFHLFYEEVSLDYSFFKNNVREIMQKKFK